MTNQHKQPAELTDETLDRATAAGGGLSPYPGFTGGVRVASGDLNADGTADIITGAGIGGHVR